MKKGLEAPIFQLSVSTFRVPTDAPESDGTLEWNQTLLVLVEVSAGNCTGLGLSYASFAAARLIDETLRDAVLGQEAMALPRIWADMVTAVRNAGRPGIASTAIAAVDNALWDLKARLLGIPLFKLLGEVRGSVPVYGSGGFTSYSVTDLQRQLAGWLLEGIPRVKMKVGRDPAADVERVQAARAAIGPSAELYVDANGAYSRQRALRLSREFAAEGVSWFEEPVSSDDLPGLASIRANIVPGMDIAAGEYGYDTPYFQRMLAAGAVDVLQIDATRCLGITGFLKAAALAEASLTPISAHTAPSVHAHVCCAVPGVRHVEYFHDHARIEKLLFDGALVPVNGELRPDPCRAGIGLELKRREAAKYAA